MLNLRPEEETLGVIELDGAGHRGESSFVVWRKDSPFRFRPISIRSTSFDRYSARLRRDPLVDQLAVL
jgi:hypothetical protein